MKIKHIVLVLSALLFWTGIASAQMIQTNYNGTGIIYANTGRTEIGNAPPNVAITWPGLQTFTGGITVTGTTTLTSPTFVTPFLGVATATSINGNTFTTGTYTLTGATGKTLTFNNSITLAGTDSTTMTFPSTSATIARTDAANTFTGTQTIGALVATSLAVSGGATQHFYVNQSTATQTPSAATRTYIAGSGLTITAGQIQVGTIIRWHFDMTKTAAGSASSTFDIAFGTAGTTADTARVSFTKPAGTAAADEGWVDIECVVKTNSSSGVVVGEFRMIHNLAATGHAAIPCVVVNTISSAFDTTLPTNVGICITSGASDAITINQVSAEAINL